MAGIEKIPKWFGIVSVAAVITLQASCTSEQFKNSTYRALHDREQQQCREAGRQNCSRAESYYDYEKKRKEAQKESN